MTLVAIDSHGHLQDAAFDADREAVWDRAVQAGVGVIVPGYTLPTSEAAVAWVRPRPQAWALVGLHPHDARDWQPGFADRLTAWLSQERVVGIGEIGLDYHYNHSAPEVQRAVFFEQLQLARRLNVPVSVHMREAEEDTWRILREVGHPRGVIHSFTGSWAFAERVLDLGWYLSFSGIVSFKNAQDLRQVAAKVPRDRFLIETDSPYLSPVPWRGQRNEPVRVIRVAEVIAAQKNCRTEEVLALAMSNTITLFSLNLPSN
ncbi:MAG: TatD family hydrolase [Firmicutes bacterium]|nr:TatD family hydrolase [Bacillota bacterium]